jgi:O-acetyl-ADP-ribose deacetylase
MYLLMMIGLWLYDGNSSKMRQSWITTKSLDLLKGYITKRDVDVIANAANSYLKHGGGVAAAIVRKGREIIQLEGDKIGFVPVGSAVVTSAGKLPYKAVIHTVGPSMVKVMEIISYLD